MILLYKILKNLFMHTIIGSSGRDCVLIILFSFMALRLGFLKVIYSGWVNMISTVNLHIGKRTNPLLL